MELNVLREACIARMRYLRQGANSAGPPSASQSSYAETDGREVPVGVQSEGETLQPGD